VPVAIRRWACGLPAKRRRDTADRPHPPRRRVQPLGGARRRRLRG
jgi:hypothetical protein